jgi:hypothetical protein
MITQMKSPDVLKRSPESAKSHYPWQSVIQTDYDLVKAHGGELKVDTLYAEIDAPAGREQEGTTFHIILPLI